MIIHLRFAITIILSFSISILLAQVEVKNEKKIDTKGDLIYSEPHLAVNPANSNHLLIGTMYFNPSDEKDYGCLSMTSKDNGKTWSFFKFPIAEGADPWCEFTPNGEAVFSVLGLDSLYVYHSKDGGLGRILVGEVVDRLLQQGINSMILFADPANPAIQFYEVLQGQRLLDKDGIFGGAYGWHDLQQLAERCKI